MIILKKWKSHIYSRPNHWWIITSKSCEKTKLARLIGLLACSWKDTNSIALYLYQWIMNLEYVQWYETWIIVSQILIPPLLTNKPSLWIYQLRFTLVLKSFSMENFLQRCGCFCQLDSIWPFSSTFILAVF